MLGMPWIDSGWYRQDRIEETTSVFLRPSSIEVSTVGASGCRRLERMPMQVRTGSCSGLQ
jgi:hypothetical protein